MPIEDFGAFVASELEVAYEIGERLGAGFTNIHFVNALLGRWPDLSRQQAGRFASIAIRSARAAAELLGRPPDEPFPPGSVPFVPGLFGDTSRRLRYQIRATARVQDPATGSSYYRNIILETANPASLNELLDAAVPVIVEALKTSPPLGGISEEVEIAGVEIRLIVGGD